MESKYGALTAPAKIGSVTIAASTPIIHTAYTFKVGLKTTEWCMISAMQFVGTDMKVEMVGIKFPGWSAAAAEEEDEEEERRKKKKTKKKKKRKKNKNKNKKKIETNI